MFNLGKEIFYIDTQKGIREGIVLGYSINEQGHDVYSIKDGQTYIVVFSTFCFETAEDAQKEWDRIFPLNEKIKELQNNCNAEIDSLLDEIRGKPKFEHLTLKAEKTEQ